MPAVKDAGLRCGNCDGEVHTRSRVPHRERLEEPFFPGVSPCIGTLAAFATYFVGFLARPFGAAIFGHWGERIGRKRMLIVTLLMIYAVSVYILISVVITLIVLKLLKDRSRSDITDEETYTLKSTA